MKDDLLYQIGLLPSRPGVYLFKGKGGEILYIGKAKDLKKRVRSYFQGDGKDVKTSVMLSRVQEVDHIVTETEKEALILEDALIKEHKPRYNIKLRDDKRYPLLRLSVQERWPRLSIARKVKEDGAVYFGPFPSAQAVRETMRVLHKVFPLRSCSNSQFAHRSRPCLNYQMKRCLAPCCQEVDEGVYREMVEQVTRFLQGESSQVIEEMRRKMEEAAEGLRFEEAARLRDRIASLEKIVERQKVVTMGPVHQDVLSMVRHGGKIGIYVLNIRGGKLLGGQYFQLKDVGLPDEEVLSSFLRRFYQKGRYIPQEVVVPEELEDAPLLSVYLGTRIVSPRGDRRREELLRMAEENARERLSGAGGEGVLEELRSRFRLSQLPRRIEAFDISNIGGDMAVGSMVVFLDGSPAKDQYRRYQIKGVRGIDDYAMIYEVLRRRMERAQEEGEMPDLLLIDGGKGHLKVALKVLEELGIEGVDCLSIAKKRDQAEEDRIFIPRGKDPIVLKDRRPSSLLLKRIRDEAHRFAISYHRRLRRREVTRSLLDDIPGIGPERKRALLRNFGDLEGVMGASVEELAGVPGIGPKTAEMIYQYLHGGAR